MARPTILNAKWIENFCQTLRLSGSIETAIAQSGCGRESFYRWKRRVRDGIGTKLERRFMEAVDKSEGEIKLRAEYAFSKFFVKKWRPIAFWLERKYPDEYGRKHTMPAEDPDIPAEKVFIDRIALHESPRCTVPELITKTAPKEASEVGIFEAVEAVSFTWVHAAHYQSPDLEPLLGRLLTAEDDRLDAPVVAVITDGYWVRRFGRNPEVIGKGLQLGHVAVTVVGVSRPDFTGFPNGPVADVTMAKGVMPRFPTSRGPRTISWSEQVNS